MKRLIKQAKNGKCSRGVESSYFGEGKEILIICLSRKIICLPKRSFAKKRTFFPKNDRLFAKNDSLFVKNNHFLPKTLPKTFAKFPLNYYFWSIR